jgi:hypothetical protein
MIASEGMFFEEKASSRFLAAVAVFRLKIASAQTIPSLLLLWLVAPWVRINSQQARRKRGVWASMAPGTACI